MAVGIRFAIGRVDSHASSADTVIDASRRAAACGIDGRVDERGDIDGGVVVVTIAQVIRLSVFKRKGEHVRSASQ